MNITFYYIPTSCLELKGLGYATDGNYSIDPDGIGSNPAFEVYCANMSTDSPKEYLNLIEVMENNKNYAYFPRTASPACTQTCNWTKVRILNLTGDIRISSYDKTFTSCVNTGGTACNTGYGVASDCIGQYSHTGKFNINLTGTPFRVNWEGGVSWYLSGYREAGSILINESDGIAVEGDGGGYSGSFYPKNPPGLLSDTFYSHSKKKDWGRYPTPHPIPAMWQRQSMPPTIIALKSSSPWVIPQMRNPNTKENLSKKSSLSSRLMRVDVLSSDGRCPIANRRLGGIILLGSELCGLCLGSLCWSRNN